MEKTGIDGKDGETGATGPAGNGITSITKTGTSGLIDTYTIAFTNGTTTTYEVKNGETGATGPAGQDRTRPELMGKTGQNGQDGYTPVRGTDYWTAQDIATIETYCNNYIDANITQAIGGAY